MINKACFGITEQMVDLHFHFFGWSDILTSGLIGGLNERCKGHLWLTHLGKVIKKSEEKMRRVRKGNKMIYVPTLTHFQSASMLHLWFLKLPRSTKPPYHRENMCSPDACWGIVLQKTPNDKNGTAVVWKFECADGMRHTDLRPIVKHQQRAICTATKAEMRDLHTGGPGGGGTQGPEV